MEVKRWHDSYLALDGAWYTVRLDDGIWRCDCGCTAAEADAMAVCGHLAAVIEYIAEAAAKPPRGPIQPIHFGNPGYGRGNDAE